MGRLMLDLGIFTISNGDIEWRYQELCDLSQPTWKDIYFNNPPDFAFRDNSLDDDLWE